MKKLMTLGVTLLAAATLTACGNGGNKSNGGKSDQTSATSQKKNAEFRKVGDKMQVRDVEYTLTDVTKTDERNDFAKEKPANVIKVTYTVKNKSKESVSVGMDLEAYGPGHKKLATYPNDSTMATVAPGKSIDAVQYFSSDKLGEIELLFSPLGSFDDKSVAKFKTEVK